MKTVSRVLLSLHIFVGLGAVAGGLAAILDPRKPLGMSAEYLKNSPFDDFLIPGIILFAVIGLGNLFAAGVILLKSKYSPYASGVIGGALAVWIVVQCIMLLAVAILHIIFFSVGAVQGILALILLFDRRLFPANLVIDFINRTRGKTGNCNEK